MLQKEWMTIPVLLCVALDETLAFWESLGFERRYYQKSPYPYAVVGRGDYDLHYIQQKGIKAGEAVSGCLVMVTDVEAVHEAFSKALRGQLGRVPHQGLPRISRMRPKQTRFTLTDPSGNWLIFIKLGEEDEEVWMDAENVEGTRLEKAYARAIRFREFKTDYAGAAKILDTAFERMEEESRLLHARALLLRAEIALDMEESDKARECFQALRQLDLSEGERDELESEFQRLEALEKSL